MPFLLTNDAVEISQEINLQGDVLLAFMTIAPFTQGPLQASQARHRAWRGAWPRYAPVYTYRGREPRQLDHQHGRPQFAPCRAWVDRFSYISTMSPTSQCNLRHSRANARSISGPRTVICLHYKLYRAEHRRSGPSPPPLGGPGLHDISVGRARSEASML